MHMKMFSLVFNLVVLPLWLPLWYILSFFCMFPHCDSSYHNLCNVCQFSLYYYVFSLVLHVWCSVVLEVHSFASTIVMPSSHNITASLCYCSVNHFIFAIAIMRYDYKLVLNNIIKKKIVVGICKP
jgi:hypothetical protein